MSSPVCPHSHPHLELPFLLILAILRDVNATQQAVQTEEEARWPPAPLSYLFTESIHLSINRKKQKLFSCVYLWSPVILIGCSCVRIQWPLRNHFQKRETIVLEEIKFFIQIYHLLLFLLHCHFILSNKYLWMNFTGQVRLSHVPCSVFSLELSQMNRNKCRGMLWLALGGFTSLNPVSLRTIPDLGSLSPVCIMWSPESNSCVQALGGLPNRERLKKLLYRQRRLEGTWADNRGDSHRTAQSKTGSAVQLLPQ